MNETELDEVIAQPFKELSGRRPTPLRVFFSSIIL